MNIANLFDTYSRKARLTPALFALFAPFLSLAIWSPMVYELAVGLISLFVFSGLLVVLAHLSRYLGRKVESRLEAAWGALPSVVLLRHRDTRLDEYTKQRYHQFLTSAINHLKLPSADLEKQNPQDADQKYSSACRWLREQTRDKSVFSLLAKENIEYGFRRNMRGLKSIGVALAGASFLFGGWILTSGWPTGVALPGMLAVLVSFVVWLIWVFLVTDDWVEDAAMGYACRLLAACDTLGNAETN